MQAITIMLGAAFLWSLYPLMIAYSDGRIGGALMVFIIHISCGISAALFAFIKVRDRANSWKNIVAVTKTLQFEHWMYLMLIGLASTLYNFCFIYAMEVGSKIGSAIIIEGWPIIAIFLAPLLVTKSWKKVTVFDVVAAFVALGGVALIMIEDSKNISNIFATDAGLPTNIIIGSAAALMGSLSLAASVVLSSEVSNRLSKYVLKEKKHSLACAFIGETIRRIVALPSSAILLFAFAEDMYTDSAGIALSVIIGVVIFCIGSAAVTLALLRSSSSTINMLYYASPILAVVWLYLAGLGTVTPLIVTGGCMVVMANILTIHKNKKYHLEPEIRTTPEKSL